MLLALAIVCSCAPEKKVMQGQAVQPPPVAAVPQPLAFSAWLSDFRHEAQAKGISKPVLDDAFTGLTQPLQSVLDRDYAQPEHTKTFEEYLHGVLKPRRIEAARAQRDSHAQVLAQVEEAYGVPAPVLLALWQSESNFGAIQGNFSVVESLATLAYDGRRAAFFRTELLNALTILQQEHMSSASLTGSWAGAMGQVQFMPSSYLAFAVDFDGDGKKDIWHSDADALASMANYLHTRGWDGSIGWGFRVRVPQGANAARRAAAKEWHSFQEWRKLGLRMKNGGRLPDRGYDTKLVMPDNDPDNAFLMTSNYDVLMDWNHSIYFATSVGLLSDAVGKP